MAFIVGGVWLESLPVAAFCFFGTPIILTMLLVKGRVKKLNNAYAFMSENVISSLEKADYFNTGEYGAIAVDAEKSIVSTIAANQKFKFGNTLKFHKSKIRNYKAFSPSYNTWDSVGDQDLSTQSEVIRKNTEAKAAAHAESGLYIDLDDIECPSVFVHMEYSEAEKWMLIFEKLLNDTLESRPKPMMFPK